MVWLDWLIVGIYIALMVGMGLYLSLRQKDQTDYYLAGRRLGAWTIALSIVATQCSANSLIGAPAFIALRQGGGLGWLQYELAVPLAAIVILLLIPVFFQRQITTIYEVVETRYGVSARTTLSGIFLFSRSLGTAVTLYATAVVVSACLNWPLAPTILFVGVISIFYTTLGGIEADIYSDILQLIILVAGTIACIFVVIKLLGGFPTDFSMIESTRLQVLDFQGTGIADSNAYSIWPMLIGGFFLYISYYGCDQSQAQRLLAAKNQQTAQRAIVYNALLRFPLVCTYCLFGLLLAVWLAGQPGFVERIWERGKADYLVPMFILDYVPAGVRGLIVASIIAAAMSSLDSAINSLSAATQRDFIDRFVGEKQHRILGMSEVVRARAITVVWGIFCTGFAFFFAFTAQGKSGPTVLELVNMIGSAVNGPILAVFLMTLLPWRQKAISVVIALCGGVGANCVLWLAADQSVSWFWWNVVGCLVSGLILLATAKRDKARDTEHVSFNWSAIRRYAILLIAAFVIIFALLILLNKTMVG